MRKTLGFALAALMCAAASPAAEKTMTVKISESMTGCVPACGERATFRRASMRRLSSSEHPR